MKRVELKRIVEFLRKGKLDEKIPFASQGTTLPDNGSFSKNFEADDNKKAAKEFPGDGGDILEGPMSISRKVCFAMSFNLWILYFLALAWLIPCSSHDCGWIEHGKMEIDLSNLQNLTNVEPMNGRGLPSLAMLGYSDGRDLKLAALATFDATFEWNNTLLFIPRKVQCNFENDFDANRDGIPDCLLSGYSDVYAFNASNGYVFWHHSFLPNEGNISSLFHPTGAHGNDTFLIGAYGNKMVILNSRTGKKTFEADLPCYATLDIKIVTSPVANSNYTLWGLVCNYGDEVEAWGFEERDVLSRGNSENKANAFEFALLFSAPNSGGSIDFGCDVIPVPGGPLLLSWADRVVMVTQEATEWELPFPDTLTVACIAVGNFTLKEIQVAAAVHNGTDTIVYIIRTKDGSIVDYVTVKDRNAQSLVKVSGVTDSLLMKSAFFGKAQLDNSSDPTPANRTNFAVIDFHSHPYKIKDIVTESTVVASALSSQTNGERDLLVIKTENETTTYQKFVLHGSDTQYAMCLGKKHAS